MHLTSNFRNVIILEMRTTLALEDDAAETVKAYARMNRISQGQAASELIRRGARYQLGLKKKNGVAVFDVPDDFPGITTERVRELLAEE